MDRYVLETSDEWNAHMKKILDRFDEDCVNTPVSHPIRIDGLRFDDDQFMAMCIVPYFDDHGRLITVREQLIHYLCDILKEPYENL